ncbi:ankyrin repeat domain-containing protein [Lusitaniella coriacea]|uniref:ankyrin repeat domain-containing protein n=1 Tax=Lusitaniella coriacea TaxID=1983105 RepID=UPI003CF69EDD
MDFSKNFRQAITQKAPIEQFIDLLEQCNNCNCVIREEEERDSPIHLAVIHDRLDVVKLLVQKGASLESLEIDSRAENLYSEFQDFGFEDDEDRLTGDPLETAASRGKQEIFNFLAPLASVSQRRRATLYLADGIELNSISNTQSDRTEFQKLVNVRPSTNESDVFGKWLSDLAKSTTVKSDLTDTFNFFSSRFSEKCQHHVSQGFDVNEVGENGCTLLWTAAHNGYIEAVHKLIELGALIDMPNQKDGWTPLMIAVDSHIPWTFGTQTIFGKQESHQVEVVNILLQGGANINYRGNNGETALRLAREFEQNQGFEKNVLDAAIHEMEFILRNAGATD